MPKFTHPTVRNGQITYGEAEYPIVDGVVECPAEIAATVHGLEPVRELDPSLPSNPQAGELTGPLGDGVKPLTGITSVNADKAKALVAEAETIDAVKAMEAEESASPSPRVSVLRAIEKRLAELLAAGNAQVTQ